jgi:hypothetical protein
MIKESMARK